MRNFLNVLFSLMLLFLILTNCRKIESPTPGQLEMVTITDLSSIPEEYGKLIAVTTHAQYEGWAQLWFEDSVQTIRMVRVQFRSKLILEEVLVIPRTK